nr:OsmC family protein [Actinobacillus porcinus]
MKIFYKTSATATGGRDGRTQVDDGSIGFDLVSFQNESGKIGTNPEQLFAMGYAACFDSAMNHVAPKFRLKTNQIKHHRWRGYRTKSRWCI